MGRMRSAPRDVFARRSVAREARTLSVLAVIALGGGLGSVARYLVGAAVPGRPGGFPWGTFLINVTGCFALGLLMVYVLEVWPPRRYVRPFFGVGVLGGYTTFSTVTVEILQRPAGLALLYALCSLAGGLVAVWAGMSIARLTALQLRQRSHGERSHGEAG
ncbi:CrcB protein [Planotetraspora sp. GP83]